MGSKMVVHALGGMQYSAVGHVEGHIGLISKERGWARRAREEGGGGGVLA